MERLHKRSAAEELQEFYGTLFHVTSYEHWIKSSLDNAIDVGNVASRSVYGFTTVSDRKRMMAIKNAECVQQAIIRTTEQSSGYWKIDNSSIKESNGLPFFFYNIVLFLKTYDFWILMLVRQFDFTGQELLMPNVRRWICGNQYDIASFISKERAQEEEPGASVAKPVQSS